MWHVHVHIIIHNSSSNLANSQNYFISYLSCVLIICYTCTCSNLFTMVIFSQWQSLHNYQINCHQLQATLSTSNHIWTESRQQECRHDKWLHLEHLVKDQWIFINNLRELAIDHDNEIDLACHTFPLKTSKNTIPVELIT